LSENFFFRFDGDELFWDIVALMALNCAEVVPCSKESSPSNLIALPSFVSGGSMGGGGESLAAASKFVVSTTAIGGMFRERKEFCRLAS